MIAQKRSDDGLVGDGAEMAGHVFERLEQLGGDGGEAGEVACGVVFGTYFWFASCVAFQKGGGGEGGRGRGEFSVGGSGAVLLGFYGEDVAGFHCGGLLDVGDGMLVFRG